MTAVYCHAQVIPLTYRFFNFLYHRANFSGGGMSYTEYHAHVTRAISGLPG